MVNKVEVEVKGIQNSRFHYLFVFTNDYKFQIVAIHLMHSRHSNPNFTHPCDFYCFTHFAMNFSCIFVFFYLTNFVKVLLLKLLLLLRVFGLPQNVHKVSFSNYLELLVTYRVFLQVIKQL